MSDSNGRGRTCELCGREVERLTRHHLIPRSRHRKILGSKKRRRLFDREDLNRTVLLCGPCHRKVHQTFTEAELERHYPTVEALSSAPEIERFVDWISGKRQGTIQAPGSVPGGAWNGVNGSRGSHRAGRPPPERA